MARKGYVRYDAPTQFNTRTITKQNWEQLGVTDMETVHWGPENNWKIPADKFSHDAWPFIEAESSLLHEEDTPPPVLRKEEVSDDRVEVSEPVARETPAAGRKRGGR